MPAVKCTLTLWMIYIKHIKLLKRNQTLERMNIQFTMKVRNIRKIKQVTVTTCRFGEQKRICNLVGYALNACSLIFRR